MHLCTVYISLRTLQISAQMQRAANVRLTTRAIFLVRYILYIKTKRLRSQWKPKAYRMVRNSDNSRVIVIFRESPF